MTGPARRRLPRFGWFGAGLLAGGLAGVAVFAGVQGLSAAEDPEMPVPPLMVEETVSSGVVHVYDGDFTFFVGGGVGVMDCDEDGFPDLYLAGGSNPAGLYRNLSDSGGGLRFAHVPGSTTDLEGVTGAYPLDVDSDGVVDLAVLRVGENVLLRGLGDCRFERANEAWSFEGGDEWTAAFSATWEGEARLPTLAVGNYLEVPEPGDPARVCSDSLLLRPEGDGYGERLALSPGLCTLSVLFADWDGSGRHDLRMANDRHYYTEGQEQLWRIEEGEPPRLYTAEEGWKPLEIWGMGIAAHDVTGDGLSEVFLTSQGDNKLQALEAGPASPSYVDIAIRRGATAHRPFMGGEALPSTAWHPEFEDVNNDGFMDLYISKGNVEAQPDHAAADPSNLLLGDESGHFTEAAREAGVVSLGRGRGAAVVDLNLDGLLDLVEVNRSQNVRLWRNQGEGDRADRMGNWVALRLRQEAPNRDAVGAWIEARAGDWEIRREVTIGGGHAGGQLGWIHVGIGDRDSVDVRVRWPDGETGPWMGVEAGVFAFLEKGSAEPRLWEPPR